MTDIIVSSSQTSTGITLSSGDTETVLSGGAADFTTIDGGGLLTVSFGGNATSTTINNGGSETVLGTGFNTQINGGGSETVLAGGNANNDTISSGGSLTVFAGGSAGGDGILSGGSETVSSGGVVSQATIFGGGVLTVVSGGSAGFNTVFSGGSLTVSGGFSEFNLITSGGSETVLAGGNASNEFNEGLLAVLSGGIAISTTIDSGGDQSVNSGGAASSTIVDSGGTEIVGPGGSDVSTIVSSGGHDDVGGVASGTVVAGGQQVVDSGGVASGTTVSQGGQEAVFGVAIATIVSSGGHEDVESGGSASFTTINSGGFEDVLAGGGASSSTIDSGGSLTVESGATTVDTAINGPGAVFDLLSGAVVSGGITFSGSGGQLQIAGSAMPSSTISGFVSGDTFDLASITFDSGGSANLTSGSQLQITESGTTYNLQLDPSQNFAGDFFHLADDSSGGTLVTEDNTPPTAFSWASATSGNWSTALDWAPGGGPPMTSADSADISVSGAAYTATLDVSETIGSLTMDNFGAGLLAIGANSLTVTTAGGLGGNATVTTGFISIAGGILSANGSSGISLAAGGGLSGFGTLEGSFVFGPGFLQATGGTLDIASVVDMTATGLSIANSSTAVLQLDNTVALGSAITFVGAAGTLDLTDFSGGVLQGFQGTIRGLNVGSSGTVPTNQIDLGGELNVTDAGLDTTTDVVTVTTTGGSFTLQLFGTYAPGTLVDRTIDGSSTGTDLFLSTVPCYCHGTMLLTERGEVAVEELRVGDPVVTLDGAAKPIRWIGQRAYDGRFIAGKREVLPVCVTAGALADGVPARDLFVSPGHSLYIDGVLVQAEHLVNGATIVQAEAVERVEYFHIELDAHDVVFAEGTPAETFVDCDNRMMFANGAGYALLHPDDERPSWAFCAPRLAWEADELTQIRALLLERAAALGHALDLDPQLHLVVDGEVVRPDRVAGDVYRFALPAGSAAVWLASRRAVPAETEAASRDVRRLGVPVRRLALADGDLLIEAAHGHAALSDGFHAAEAGHRWTDGLARLPESWLRSFPGPLTLKVYLAPRGLAYRLPPPRRARAAA